MIKVRNAEALNGHRLALDFSDGTSGIADLSKHIKRKPFLGLQEDPVFRHVVVEHGAVEWPDGDVGIATEALYALVHGLPKPETLEQVSGKTSGPPSIRKQLREAREHADALDRNWANMHECSMGAIRDALGMPDASVPEMVQRINQLADTRGRSR